MQLATKRSSVSRTAFGSSSTTTTTTIRPARCARWHGRFAAAAAADNEANASTSQQQQQQQPGTSTAQETTEKYGLEAGLYQVLTSKDAGGSAAPVSRTEQAKRLLAQYGSAYLLTSISFAIVSFAACYAAVSAGVDVAGLLARIGLSVNDTSEKVGTFAIAYAAHKALSPVRFPPTVALTPVVARWTGKGKQQGEADAQQQAQQQGQQAAAGDGSSSNGSNSSSSSSSGSGVKQ